MNEKSVCVVGAGVVGLCCAEALLSKGYAVTLVDRGAPGDGCSYGNGGLIVPSHFEPLATPGMLRTGLRMTLTKDSPFGFGRGADYTTLPWIIRFARSASHSHVERSAPLLRDLHLASREIYAKMASRLGFDFGFEKKGLIMVCQTDAGFESERKLAKMAERLGLASQILSRADLLSSGIQAVGGVYFEDDAQLSPRSFMEGMRSYLEQAGVSFRSDHDVAGFEAEGRRVVAASGGYGMHKAGQFVVCAGVWSRPLAETIRLKLPMLAGKGCGFTIPWKLEQVRAPLILTEARIAVTPYASETRFVGLMELGKPGFECSPRRIARMRQAARSALPQLKLEDLESVPVWVGNRPLACDGMPIIGRPKDWTNLCIATGHAMIGMSLGPITGQLVAQIVGGEPPTIDIDPLSPDRF